MYCRVLACDYDGTTAVNGKLVPEVAAALRAARAQGLVALLVTGRVLPDLHAAQVDWTAFDAVVAENGAIVWLPGRDRTFHLGSPPPAHFLGELRARGVPFHAGAVVLGTADRHAGELLDVVRRLGIDGQLAFNREALMLLPTGVDKAAGVRRALEELGRSERNLIAFGDAENDLPLLALAEVGVAARGAVPSVAAAADERLSHPGGAGVAHYIEALLTPDAAPPADRARARRPRPGHASGLGHERDDQRRRAHGEVMARRARRRAAPRRRLPPLRARPRGRPSLPRPAAARPGTRPRSPAARTRGRTAAARRKGALGRAERRHAAAAGKARVRARAARRDRARADGKRRAALDRRRRGALLLPPGGPLLPPRGHASGNLPLRDLPAEPDRPGGLRERAGAPRHAHGDRRRAVLRHGAAAQPASRRPGRGCRAAGDRRHARGPSALRRRCGPLDDLRPPSPPHRAGAPRTQVCRPAGTGRQGLPLPLRRRRSPDGRTQRRRALRRHPPGAGGLAAPSPRLRRFLSLGGRCPRRRGARAGAAQARRDRARRRHHAPRGDPRAPRRPLLRSAHLIEREEPPRVLAEDLGLHLGREIAALAQRPRRVRERPVPVRVVAREQHEVGPEGLHRKRDRRLVRLAAHPELPAGDVLARGPAAVGGEAAPLLDVLAQALDEVRHPAHP